MLLRFPDPYDFELSTRRFRAFGPDLANLWHDGGLHRVIAGREIRIEAALGGVEADLPGGESSLAVLKLLGAEFELAPFYAWAASDPVLAPIAAALAGLRPPLVPDPFEALVTSITAQQVSLRSAGAIRTRMIARFGEKATHAYAFPQRERLAQVTEADLVAVGFSRRKAEYVIGLARSELDLDALAALDDDSVRAQIIAVRGLGPWTAEWFLARHLARPRAWPAGDLVLRKAAEVLYGVDVHELGSRLDPFQNLSAQYLLASRSIGVP